MEAGAGRFGLVGETERGERLYSPGERVRCLGDGVRRRGGGGERGLLEEEGSPRRGGYEAAQYQPKTQIYWVV